MKVNSGCIIDQIFRYSLLLLLTLPFNGTVFSQGTDYNIVIPWDASRILTANGKEIMAPVIKGQAYSENAPRFIWKEKTGKNGSYTISVTDITFSASEPSDLTFLKYENIKIPTTAEYSAKITRSRDQQFAGISLFPFVMDNGELKRVSGFKIRVSPGAAAAPKPKDFVTSSVLGDAGSRWYKIAVSDDGIYKIDKAFLASMGIDVAGLNPQHINIYGNGMGKLPELNSVYRPDDLVKNDIQVIGEGDGVFDDGDYILFHAWGPSSWRRVAANFRREMNPYSSYAYYFIRISASEPPGRIGTQPASPAAPNQTVTSYNYGAIHEQELKSIVGGGQNWYGELFDSELTYTFPFNIPNVDPSAPVRFIASLATNGGTPGNSVRYSVGSELLHTVGLSTSGADYVRMEMTFQDNTPTASTPLTMTVSRVSPVVMTYLDKIELNARRYLTFTGNQFRFRDFNSVAPGNVSRFEVGGFSGSSFVWDVTNKQKPRLVSGALNGSVFTFITETDTLKEFVASNGSNYPSPRYVEQVQAQNLHALDFANLLIVTNPRFVSQAERLANLHRGEGLLVHVVTTDQIYNEFSSGALDPTAIKWFAKMFYDRANGNTALMPESLLLFGDGTYDPRHLISSTNYVPTYQVMNSENHINALVTDDYYGMLDDNESLGDLDDLDIGVGRLLISDTRNAQEQVDKIEIYMKNGASQAGGNIDCCSGNSDSDGTFGDWRLNYVQIADDEEGGYFINQDCEPQFQYVQANHPEMNADKLYCDAFPQISGAGGQRYPEVYEAITSRVQRGSLVINYVGHGGEVGAAEERIITIPQILSWTNINKLNLFVSATCEFTKYDDPNRVSAGEWMALNPNGGAIALMTTTRSVYFDVNSTTGERFYENVFQRDANFEPLTFGEIQRRTKNTTNEGINKRSFTLIGDPALKIALPRLKIVTDSINHLSPNLVNDTVEALSKMNVKGHIEDQNGNILTNYNGILSPSVFDKPKQVQTLGQDPSSPVIQFMTQRNSMYKGKVSVVNGYFDFTFIIPKDINYAYGNGKISYYGHNGLTDGSGYDTRFIVGGLNAAGLNDNEPPQVEIFLNDENFVSGGLTDESPKLIAKIFDENGVNTVGNGIGHDIVAILDDNTANPIILNDYYIADLDSYQSGKVEYNFSSLPVGKHTLQFKVWDVNNNSSDSKIEFVVVEKKDVTLDHVLNYPNPFTTRTEFYFEHNQVCEALEAQVQIFTVSGKLVKTINQLVKTRGFRTEGIEWDGKDDFGDQIGKGVYVYRLSVRTTDGGQAQKIEKLVLLK